MLNYKLLKVNSRKGKMKKNMLTQHISIADLKQTKTGLKNDPTSEDLDNLYLLSHLILEPIIRLVGHIQITSGYRSPEVNITVGGTINSDHLRGYAADFVAGQKNKLTTNEMYEMIRRSMLTQIGQLILTIDHNKPHLHVSLPRRERKNGQAIKKTGLKLKT